MQNFRFVNQLQEQDTFMRILYVAGENPAVESILKGMDESSLGGLPAFYHPFKILLERGHEIDLLLYTREKKELVESPYFKKKNLIQILPGKSILPSSAEYFLQISSATRKLLKERHYDFVYGQSEVAQPALMEAARKGIPCGLRQYGTQEMANVLEPMESMWRRRLTAVRDYTYITLSMISRKKFILATNDGSRADRLYDILGIRGKKFAFFFWTSGVYIPARQPAVDLDHGSYPVSYDPLALSMVNRVADVKRQDRAVRILGELHRRGHAYHLYLIGTIDSPKMHAAALQAADEYGVRDYIHFEGGKSQKECRQYARNSLATLLPCEWNRVNVLYEVMGEGAVVVTNDNHSIDEFIDPGQNCLLYEEDNFAQAAEEIITLSQDLERISKIRANAYQTACDKFLSIEKRFGMEADLVEEAARGGDLARFPAVI